MSGKAGSARKTPALIRLWLLLTALLPVPMVWIARRAHRRQGADPDRIAERSGQATQPRPPGALIWIHAASVGEVASVARLGRAILAADSERTLLMTTTTTTGAETVARLVPDAVHQYVPVDTPAAVSAFLDHWHPDAALFVEADLWPRLLLSLLDADCPMALVNARHSRSRERLPKVYASLLSHMALITVQDDAVRTGMIRLGLDGVRLHSPGNLKADIEAPSVNQVLCSIWTKAGTGRGVWAAVSTHDGEEGLVLDAHLSLSGSPLLILVPRHPERGDSVAKLLDDRGVRYTRHSSGAVPDTATQVHLIDGLGLTGTVFASAKLVFLGGSLLPGIGGHTPYEPAALGCAILSGTHVANFTWAFQALRDAGAARLVPTSIELGHAIAHLLEHPSDQARMQSAAQAFHAKQAGATDATLDLLADILPE